MATKNLYHRRLVDQSHAKACDLCYKLSTTVLITPESDDWFHICPLHLNDPNFASAKDADDAAKRKKEQDMDAEIEALKKEYAEKVRVKLEKRKEKDAKKDGKKDKSTKAEEKAQDEQDEKEKQEKLTELEKKQEMEKTSIDNGPRIFELNRVFFQRRIKSKRDLEVAKASRARLRSPNLFPSVPSGNP